VISVIIPVGDHRDDNLSLTLTALEGQTYRDFEVVVCCDGTDGVDGVLRKHDLPITYYWKPATRKNLGAVNRNVGARLASGEFLLFIDSDVLLNPRALEYYAADFTGFPNRAIAGPYHWCPPAPITPKDVRDWDTLSARMFALLQKSKDEIRQTEAGKRFKLDHNIGMDTRKAWTCGAHQDALYCDYQRSLQLLTGNMAIAKRVFDDVGGFCEELTSGIDGEMGLRVCKTGHVFSFDPRCVAFHQYHDRSFSLDWESAKAKIIEMHHSDDSWIGKMKRDWGWPW
jgi:glycosyltransferase involved in cell wall biosynthesis